MYNEEAVLALVKARLNRLPTDTSLDAYLTARIEAAAEELEGKGITLEETTEDLVLLTDYAVYQYAARDQQGGMPEWLRLRIRERWLRDRRHV